MTITLWIETCLVSNNKWTLQAAPTVSSSSGSRAQGGAGGRRPLPGAMALSVNTVGGWGRDQARCCPRSLSRKIPAGVRPRRPTPRAGSPPATCSPPPAQGHPGVCTLSPPLGLGRRDPPGLAAGARGLRAVQGLEDSGDLQHDRARLWVVHPLGAVQRVLEHVFKCCGETQSCWGTAPHTRWWELSFQQLPGERGPGTPQTPTPRISSAERKVAWSLLGGGHAHVPWCRDSGKHRGNSY